MLLNIVEAKKGCKKKSLNILSLAAYLLKSAVYLISFLYHLVVTIASTKSRGEAKCIRQIVSKDILLLLKQ